MGGVLDFMRRLWAVDHGLQSLSKRMQTELGVTGPQRLVLRAIGRLPKSSAGHIARLLSLDPSTLTGILQRLEKKQLVVRMRDATDRRRALFQLTAAGQRLNATRAGTVEAAVARTTKRARKKELVSTSRVLELLAEELCSESTSRDNAKN
jgi:DNA-binding MarR family transcriptional regulator